MAKEIKEIKNIEFNTLDDAPNEYSGFCPITPVPKGRPRFARKGKFVQAYTPKETLEYENAVREWARKDYGSAREPMDGSIRARYEFIVPRPKSKTRKQYFANTKPDIDNLVKSFQDALDFKAKSHGKALGVLANDSRVTTISATKRYARDGEQCGTFFSFSPDGDKAIVMYDEARYSKNLSDFIDKSIPMFMLSKLTEADSETIHGITHVLLVSDEKQQIDTEEKKRVGRILKKRFPDLVNIKTI